VAGQMAENGWNWAAGGWLCSREEEREVCVITWL